MLPDHDHDQDDEAPAARPAGAAPAAAELADGAPVSAAVSAPFGAGESADDVFLAMTTAPDDGLAERIAQVLVEERLVACVNLLAPCRSVYRWQGAVEQSEERPLLMKTTRACLTALQARIVTLHPYELPEFVAWRVDAGSPRYLGWVGAEAGPPAG